MILYPSCISCFQYHLKFQPVLPDIEDSTMCVLQTLMVFEIQCGMNPIDDNYQRLNQWTSRMHPACNEYERYECTSRYVTPFDIILSFEQLRKIHNRCKYKTREEIAALAERNYIVLGQEYDMNDILEDIDLFDQAHYFHRK